MWVFAKTAKVSGYNSFQFYNIRCEFDLDFIWLKLFQAFPPAVSGHFLYLIFSPSAFIDYYIIPHQIISVNVWKKIFKSASEIRTYFHFKKVKCNYA